MLPDGRVSGVLYRDRLELDRGVASEGVRSAIQWREAEKEVYAIRGSGSELGFALVPRSANYLIDIQHIDESRVRVVGQFNEGGVVFLRVAARDAVADFVMPQVPTGQ